MAKLLSGTRIYGSATIDTTLSLGTSAIFTGSTSGTTTLLATAVAGTTTLTLPAATDTLVGRATTDTLTNKTLTFPVINNIREGYTTTATAAGTTTLTSSSNHYQRFTGSTTQTIVLPVTSTLATGVSYVIENTSTGNLTVNSSGGNLVITIIPGVTVQCMCIGITLTTAADWDAEYTEFASITGTGSAVLSASPALTGTATFANATSSTGFLALGTASVTTNRIYATNGAGAASILGNNTFQTTSGLAGVSGTTSSAGNGHLGYFNGTVRAGVYGQIGSFDSNVTTYAGYFDGRVAVTGALIVTGDLTVNGTTTTVNSTTLTVDDKNIELGSTASPTDVTADGGGITLKGTTDKTFNWIDATDAWTSSENLNLLTGKVYQINGTTVLSATQVLGKSLPTGDVVGSSDTQTLTNKTIAGAAISGSLIPSANATYDLGSAAYKFKDLYLSGSSLFLNQTSMQTHASGIVFTHSTNSTVLPIGGGAHTLVTLAGTETLTNKTLSAATLSGTTTYSAAGSTAIINYNTGSTPTAFDVRVNATGGNGTQGNGDYNIISGTFTHNLVPIVTTSGTQSLSNKTLVSPTITGVSPTITLGGDLTGSLTLTNLAGGTLTATIAANSVALGTDTTGNYASEVVAGNGITVTGSAGEGTSFTIAHADTSSVSNLTATSRTYVTGLTFDTYGHVQSYNTASETVSNTTYSISAETATGGAKIQISGSDSSIDDVKLAAGSNINITRTDANTITIEGTASSSSSKFLVYKRGDVAPSSATPVVVSSGLLTVYGRTQNIGVLV
jgi:hypothetical protein